MPEVLVVVDTDLPVPRAAARLRIDLYDEDGRWFDTRDVARPNREDWPASFGVHAIEAERTTVIWIRARAYPEGSVRDYLGERFVDLGGSLAVSSSGDGRPRLFVDGVDRTPSSEPAPLVTVDRMFGVRLEPAKKGIVEVVLTGACAGTMTRLRDLPRDAPDRIDPSIASTCTGTSREREPVVVLPAREARPAPPARVGTWGTEGPCRPEDSNDDRICVPSGVVVLGDARLLETPYIASTPERTFHVSRFAMDRTEVSVARYRAARVRGFAARRSPVANEQAITQWGTSSCSWSESPRGREELPMTCIWFDTARDFCRFEGGDLPTEAQWEYAATSAERRYEAHFPWGDDDAACRRAVYERLPMFYPECIARGARPGPQPVAALDEDVTPLGIMGLAGNVTEWTRDRFYAYDAPCWGAASVDDPVCDAAVGDRSLRGGSWASPYFFIRGAMRQGHADGTLPFEGFRCVYALP